MNLISFSRFYIGYLLFNIGGWIHFGYLMYYTSYITTETCNSYTKELTDVVKVFVGISMALTTMNVGGATNNILNADTHHYELDIEHLYCILVTTLLLLSVSGICSLAIFGITSGMTDIRCSNKDAEFGLKLSVYGVIWIAFIEALLMFSAILLFLYNIIVNAKLHLLCNACFNVYKKYKERRVGIESSVPHSIQILKYTTHHVSIPISPPPPVAAFKEEPKVLCSVCYDSAITLLLEPCNHICICHVCYDSLVTKECPICKTKISATRKIYFANPGI